MSTDLQKSAKNPRELQLPHPGIINAADFDKHFELHCYEPSADLQPFVMHIWVQRPKQPRGNSHIPLVEITSGPNVYLLFDVDSAFIHGVAKNTFEYNAHGGVTAGVKFRPGGFYPFLQRSVSGLSDNTPITSVFPQADEAFRKRLLGKADATMVDMLEGLLRSKHPKRNKNLELIARIMDMLATTNAPPTVRATAQGFGMSERSLQLLFQTYVGVGVKWVITRRRLLEAIRRTQVRPHPTWTEVAAELGYSSQSHFSRDFKEVVGVAPTDYLRNLR